MKFKKINPDIIGAFTLFFLVIAMLVYIGISISWFSVLICLAAIAAGGFLFAFPYMVAYIWNRWIAEE